MNNDKILLIIKNYFKRNISMSTNNKNLFYDGKYDYKLKNRKHNYNNYESVKISIDKYNKRTIYLFNFNNELYFFKYDDKLFDDNKHYIISKDKLKKIDIDKYNKKYKYNIKDFTIDFEN